MEYQQPIYSGPARGAKIAAIVVLALFTIWLMAVWAAGGDDDDRDSETPTVQLEDGTLPPIVGDGASGGTLPATP
ncbi:MAG TPA: hypothetical protein VG478_12150 [Acidimicrobiales bacterium]|nr:hypothetical protein [Acidimicrobiales bacterium]